MNLVKPLPGLHSQTGRCSTKYSTTSTSERAPHEEQRRTTGPSIP